MPTPKTANCHRCNAVFDCANTGRPRRFCSGSCRVANHRAGGVPKELAERDTWTRADGKRPVTVSGRAASSTNPDTWASFSDVRRSKAGDGYGIMLGDGLGCYDLDHCTDEQAREFIETIEEPVVFAERSMSGAGVHVFVWAPEGPGWRMGVRGVAVERYTRARFIRVTGRRFF